jgi:hypothetical protein
MGVAGITKGEKLSSRDYKMRQVKSNFLSKTLNLYKVFVFIFGLKEINGVHQELQKGRSGVKFPYQDAYLYEVCRTIEREV